MPLVDRARRSEEEEEQCDRDRAWVKMHGDLKQASQIVVVDMDVQCEAESVGVASFIERQLADVRWKEVWDKLITLLARTRTTRAASEREVDRSIVGRGR